MYTWTQALRLSLADSGINDRLVKLRPALIRRVLNSTMLVSL